MKKLCAIAALVILSTSGCAGRGTDPEFPLYVRCVQ